MRKETSSRYLSVISQNSNDIDNSSYYMNRHNNSDNSSNNTNIGHNTATAGAENGNDDNRSIHKRDDKNTKSSNI